MLKQAITALCLSLPLSSFAVDLGVHGHLWDIDEVDMTQLIAAQAAEADWQAAQRELTQSAEDYTSRLPQYRLELALETKTHWVDPSVVLGEDINVPVESENGEYEWRVLHKAGTRVNPLEYNRPVSNMLFFDGNDPEQVELAVAALREHPYSLMLVETSGDPAKLAERIQVPVYYANDLLIDKFNIKRVPSLLGVGEGAQYYKLAVTELAAPYEVTVITDAWYGLPEKEMQP